MDPDPIGHLDPWAPATNLRRRPTSHPPRRPTQPHPQNAPRGRTSPPSVARPLDESGTRFLGRARPPPRKLQVSRPPDRCARPGFNASQMGTDHKFFPHTSAAGVHIPCKNLPTSGLVLRSLKRPPPKVFLSAGPVRPVAVRHCPA